jgi:hypothetical protein
MLDSKAVHNVYSAYTRNGNGQTSRPIHEYFTALKQNYPNHYVVSVSPENAEFLEYADAEHATAVLDTSSDHVHCARNYVAPRGNRDCAHQAKLSTDVYFGRYIYTWRERSYILYKTSWQTYWGEDVFWFYVLYPRPAAETEQVNDETASCLEIDELLLELGRWTAVPHKDIYLFDGGYHGYHRSKSLWDAIKDSKWDDVVMVSMMYYHD